MRKPVNHPPPYESRVTQEQVDIPPPYELCNAAVLTPRQLTAELDAVSALRPGLLGRDDPRAVLPPPAAVPSSCFSRPYPRPTLSTDALPVNLQQYIIGIHEGWWRPPPIARWMPKWLTSFCFSCVCAPATICFTDTVVVACYRNLGGDSITDWSATFKMAMEDDTALEEFIRFGVPVRWLNPSNVDEETEEGFLHSERSASSTTWHSYRVYAGKNYGHRWAIMCTYSEPTGTYDSVTQADPIDHVQMGYARL